MSDRAHEPRFLTCCRFPDDRSIDKPQTYIMDCLFVLCYAHFVTETIYNGPISSMLTNRYGCRPMIMIGGAMAGVGIASSCFAPNIYYLFFTFGAFTGAGFGIAYIPAITCVSYYFDRRITLAAGIAASGVGVGNFLYPAVIRYFINIYDWQQSMLLLGGVTLNICVLGALVRPIKRIEISEAHPILDISPFKKRGYLMLCINNFLFCCGISALYLHISALAETKGVDADRSALLISGIGISNLIGRFGYGLLGQHPRLNCFILYAVSFGFSGACVIIVPYCNTFEGLMVVCVLFGLLSGCFGTLLVILLIEILGLHRFANGYGCLLLFEAAGQLIGGPIAGALFDLTDSYTVAFVIGGALCVCSAVVMVQPYCYVKHHPRRDVMEYIVEEKAMLAASLDIPVTKYPSHMDIAKLGVSMEFLPVMKRIHDLNTLSSRPPGASLDNLSMIKRVNELRKCPSMASV